MADLPTIQQRIKFVFEGGDQATRQASGALSGLTRSFDRFGNIAGAALTTVGGSLLLFGRQAVQAGIATAAELEKTTLQFETLLGSSEAAQEKVGDLFEFAKKTPFETQPIINASRTLETFGGSALNSMENLELVGSAAAAVNRDIGALAFWFGRAYTSIQGGRPIGEAAAALQEMGVLAPEARQKIEDLQKSGADTSIVWEEMRDAFGRFSGAMEKQAGTLEGLRSTLADVKNLNLAEILTPALAQYKLALQAIIDLEQSPAFQQLKEFFTELATEIGTTGSVFVRDFATRFAELDLTNTISQFNDFMGYMRELAPLLALVGTKFATGLVAQIPVLGGLLGGLPPAFAGVAAGIGVLLGSSEEGRASLQRIGDAAMQVGTEVGPTLADALAAVSEVIADLLIVTLNALSPLLNLVADNAETLIDVLAAGAGAFAGWKIATFVSSLGQLRTTFASVIDVAGGLGGALMHARTSAALVGETLGGARGIAGVAGRATGALGGVSAAGATASTAMSGLAGVFGVALAGGIGVATMAWERHARKQAEAQRKIDTATDLIMESREALNALATAGDDASRALGAIFESNMGLEYLKEQLSGFEEGMLSAGISIGLVQDVLSDDTAYRDAISAMDELQTRALDLEISSQFQEAGVNVFDLGQRIRDARDPLEALGIMFEADRSAALAYADSVGLAGNEIVMLLDAYSRGSGDVSAFSSRLHTANDVMSQGAENAALVGAAFNDMGSIASEAADIWSVYKDQLQAIGITQGDLVAALNDTNPAAEDSSGAFLDLAEKLKGTNLASGEFTTRFQMANDALRELKADGKGASLTLFDVAQALDTGATSQEEFLTGLIDQGMSLEEAVAALKAYEDGQAAAAAATEEGTKSAKDAVYTLDDYNKALEEFKTALNGLDRSDVIQNEIDYREAVEASTAAVAENGQTLNLMTEEGRANQEALLKQAAASKQWVESLAEQPGMLGAAADKMVELRAQFISNAEAMGLSEAAAKQLADELGLIPREVDTKARLISDQARIDLARYLDAAGLTPKEIVTKVSAESGEAEGKIVRLLKKAEVIPKDFKITGRAETEGAAGKLGALGRRADNLDKKEVDVPVKIIGADRFVRQISAAERETRRLARLAEEGVDVPVSTNTDTANDELAAINRKLRKYEEDKRTAVADLNPTAVNEKLTALNRRLLGYEQANPTTQLDADASAARDAISAVQAQWRDKANWGSVSFQGHVEQNGTGPGGFSIRFFDQGGMLERGMFAVVGERGPELVFGQRGGEVMSRAGTERIFAQAHEIAQMLAAVPTRSAAVPEGRAYRNVLGPVGVADAVQTQQVDQRSYIFAPTNTHVVVDDAEVERTFRKMEHLSRGGPRR